jgi:hypothetical protein
LKISRPVCIEKTRWGKQWGKQIDGSQRKARHWPVVRSLELRVVG